jgi:poly-gamma-glutamate capsule biosynthesis protein CapA/YwtB (metallophosphatase superfamily)
MAGMNRRQFMVRTLGAAMALTIPRWARGQGSRPDTSGVAPRALTLAVGGDTTLGYNLQDHFDQQLAAGKTRDELWPLYFAGIRSMLDEADVALVNLECPFTERGKKLKKNFNFRARPELVRVLKEGSVDVVTLANNHINDWGHDGVRDTIDALDHAGIGRFGAGMNMAEARRPLIFERAGYKLGFIGYYFQAEPDMLEPKQVYATKKKAGVAGCYKDLDCIRDMVREDVTALVSKVDFAIPYFHWGHEGSYEIRDYQVELAHQCVDLGCKAVLGSHPHRLQGIEVHRGAPIFYSLGNCVYGGIKEPKDTLTMIARLRCTTLATEADVVPVQYTRWPEAPFQPFPLEGQEREDALARIASYSSRFTETLPQLESYRGRATFAPSDSLGVAR